MSQWTLESVLPSAAPYDTPRLFGHQFCCSFRLRYMPSRHGPFRETPRLDWHETILMNEHHKGEHWRFEANMYTHNPLSKTLEIWARRYVAAYNRAVGTPDAATKGWSCLQDEQGAPVAVAQLGANRPSDHDKADAVRDYLSRHGGLLFIEIEDIPSIHLPTAGEHKERLVLFDCGVEGGGPRARAVQYLDVDHAQPQDRWVRQLDLSGSMPRLRTNGLRAVPPPALVSRPRAATFAPGECW